MKKNAMLKIAAILMVAVLLTTCAISSTFAKYVTSVPATTTNTARVANWGITMTSETPALFKADYQKDSASMATSANGTDLILAPGTANDATNAFKLSITGKPEVRFNLTATVNVTLANWEVNGGEYYCPIVVKVNGTAVTAGADAAEYEDNIEDAIAAAIFGATVNDTTDTQYTKEYAPNEVEFGTPVDPAQPEGAKKNSVYVTWEWPTETSAANNEKDTALGNASTKATISISYALTAEQVASNHAK